MTLNAARKVFQSTAGSPEEQTHARGGCSDGGAPLQQGDVERRVRLSVVPPLASDAEEAVGVAPPAARPPKSHRRISYSPPCSSPATVPPTVKYDIQENVRRAQAGDAQAFAALFEEHRGIVTRIAFRMLGPSADLDDIVQEVFLQVYKSLPRFRGQSKFTTWLHRVTVNVVLMSRRRAKSRPKYVSEEAGGADRVEPQSALPDSEVSRGRRVTAFRRLLDKLSEKKRTVFILHELNGMSPAEIAVTVDCPVLTVRTRLFYARRELAQLMHAEPSLAALLDPPTEASDAEEKATTSKKAKAL